MFDCHRVEKQAYVDAVVKATASTQTAVQTKGDGSAAEAVEALTNDSNFVVTYATSEEDSIFVQEICNLCKVKSEFVGLYCYKCTDSYFEYT